MISIPSPLIISHHEWGESFAIFAKGGNHEHLHHRGRRELQSRSDHSRRNSV